MTIIVFRVPLMNLSGNGQIADPHFCAEPFAPSPVHCLREFKAVAKKEEGNAAVSDNSLLERATEDSHLTLDVGVCLRADCAPNECQKSLLCP